MLRQLFLRENAAPSAYVSETGPKLFGIIFSIKAIKELLVFFMLIVKIIDLKGWSSVGGQGIRFEGVELCCRAGIKFEGWSSVAGQGIRFEGVELCWRVGIRFEGVELCCRAGD